MCELACFYMYSFKKEIHEICADCGFNLSTVFQGRKLDLQSYSRLILPCKGLLHC